MDNTCVSYPIYTQYDERLHLHEAAGAELRSDLGSLRSSPCDGTEVREDPTPGLRLIDERLERGIKGIGIERGGVVLGCEIRDSVALGEV